MKEREAPQVLAADELELSLEADELTELFACLLADDTTAAADSE